METSSPAKQTPVFKGPKKRGSIHGRPSTSKPVDTSSDTVPISLPAKIDNKDESSNETGEERPSTRIQGEEENDDDRDIVPERVEEGNKELLSRRSVEPETARHIKPLLRRSVEPETARQKVPQSPIKASAPEEIKQPPKYTVIIVLAIAMLAAVIAILMTHSVPEEETTDGRQSCKNFQQLQSKYPNTDDMLWATLIVGVERAVNDPGEPATFIFLYNSSSVGQSLLMDVIRITIQCFGNGDAIWRTSNDFKSAEITGVVLDRHREELEAQGVLVVRDLDRVPPNAAKVFFTICDSYEPLVRKAVIFFTIDISQRAANQSQRSPTSIAEGILKDLWRKELHSNVLDPLVVRLTENVFKID